MLADNRLDIPFQGMPSLFVGNEIRKIVYKNEMPDCTNHSILRQMAGVDGSVPLFMREEPDGGFHVLHRLSVAGASV